jgi:hypothetical protein
MSVEESGRDLLAEWMRLGGEVLERYYPGAPYAVYVIERGEGLPSVQLVISRTASSAPSRPSPGATL